MIEPQDVARALEGKETVAVANALSDPGQDQVRTISSADKRFFDVIGWDCP